MRRLLDRLGDVRGETLVESLIAILICSLSAVMLIVATTTAVRMNAAAEARDKALQAAQQVAEGNSGTSTPATASVKSGGSSLGTVAYQVDVYGSVEALSAYALEGGSGASTYAARMQVLWNTAKTQKVTVKSWLSDTTVSDASGDVQTQELQKRFLAANGGAYPALTTTETSMSALISTGTSACVWKPVVTSSGLVMLCACVSNADLGAISSCPLVYYAGSYYRWDTLPLATSGYRTTYVTDNAFAVSALTAGGASRYTAAWQVVS